MGKRYPERYTGLGRMAEKELKKMQKLSLLHFQFYSVLKITSFLFLSGFPSFSFQGNLLYLQNVL